jgi:hypothetical protein
MIRDQLRSFALEKHLASDVLVNLKKSDRKRIDFEFPSLNSIALYGHSNCTFCRAMPAQVQAGRIGFAPVNASAVLHSRQRPGQCRR